MSEPVSIKEIINRDGIFVSVPHGDSMWPLLHNKIDTACVVKKTGRLKKHDVALYVRKSGQYVLHRVMKVTDSGYVMCGDSQTFLEHGITEDQVIGVLDSFYRNDKYHTCKEKRYKIYVKIWCISFFTRKVMMKFYGYYENKKNQAKDRKKAREKTEK